MEGTSFGRQMGDLGCRSTRERVPTEDGRTTRVRGYLIADIRAAVERVTAVDSVDTPESRVIADDG